MTNKELISALRTASEAAKMGHAPTWAMLMSKAADAIGYDWVPCTERLPRGGSQVLICLEYPDGSQEVSLGEYWGKAKGIEHGWGGFGGNGIVTHWMPLPTPPKGGHDVST